MTATAKNTPARNNARAYLAALQSLLVECGYDATSARILDTRESVAHWLSRPATDSGLPAAIVISEAPDALHETCVEWDGMTLTLDLPKLDARAYSEAHASYALAFYD